MIKKQEKCPSFRVIQGIRDVMQGISGKLGMNADNADIVAKPSPAPALKWRCTLWTNYLTFYRNNARCSLLTAYCETVG